VGLSRGGELTGHPLVSVVLPCLNEAESVALCVDEALTTMREAGIDGEVVVADNGSDDGSPEIARDAGARVIHVLDRGYGNAIRAGFAAADGAIVVMADADFTYNLDRIPDLIEPVRKGEADLVLGSRRAGADHTTMPFLHKYVGTPALTFLTARACGRRVVSDSQSGFRALRKDCLDELNLASSGMEFASEMLIRGARIGLRIEEIETGYRPRVGESKLSTWSDGWRHLQLILMLAPDVVLVGPGLLLLALGMVMLGMAFAKPEGIQIGSLLWQPVFFSGIAIVLGVLAVLSGVVIAHYSGVARPEVNRRFAFVGHPYFPRRAFALGVALVIVGLGLNLVLFFNWLGGSTASHSFGIASASQTLIIVGAILASFGLISRFLRAQSARVHQAAPRVDAERSS
jgi:glycosyltransferase involved in cell wall biosynthesis